MMAYQGEASIPADAPQGGAAALPPLAAIPADLQSLGDYERRAADHMPAASWRHLQSGTGEEWTLRENRAAFDRHPLIPRVLRDLRQGGTSTDLLGEHHEVPFMLAPLAYQKLAHADGELATVRAAAALGVGMIVSTLSSVTLEDIAHAGKAMAEQFGRGVPPLWFQLYPQADRDWTLDLVRRAEAAGYSAIVLTVDASIKLAHFDLPQGVDAANLRGMPRSGHTSIPGDSHILFGTPLVDAAPRWDDLRWLRDRTGLPIILKGVMSARDAETALEHGVDAVVVSNHGGRVLDAMPSPLAVLPGMAQAVGGRMPILFDSGIRKGTDIVKTLALGADFVLLGRPQMHALAVAGMIGVAHALHLLRAELELAMAQSGCATIGDIDGSLIN